MGNNKLNELATVPLTEQSIKERIIQFNLDSTIDELRRYYATPSTWEIIKKSRSETCHTQFLAWLFGNKEFNADPNAGVIKKLIVLLLKWAKKQNTALFDNALEESIYNQSLSIDSYEVNAEYPINLKDLDKETYPTYGKGIVDIFIRCKTTINKGCRYLNIIIENKIDAPETMKCFDYEGRILQKPNKDNIKTTLFQTDEYRRYFEENVKYKDDINLYVFLKPIDGDLEKIKPEDKCHCQSYIHINYQEILDNIIQPLSEQKGISKENRVKLQDYIKVLGKPSQTDSNQKIKIMAMEKKEKKLLEDFFENNQELIRAAIYSLNNPELSEAIENVDKKGRPRKYYTINSKGKFSMYKVLEEYIKFRLQLDSTIAISKINEDIRECIGRGNVYVSDNNDIKVDRESLHYGSLNIPQLNEIRYTKEWADSDEDSNFRKFRTSVNKNYNDFQIKQIQ